MHSVSCVYNKLFLYCLDLFLRSVEHTYIKIHQPWTYIAAVGPFSKVKRRGKNLRLCQTMLKYDVSHRLQFNVPSPNCMSTVTVKG